MLREWYNESVDKGWFRGAYWRYCLMVHHRLEIYYNKKIPFWGMSEYIKEFNLLKRGREMEESTS